ncbi:hypothetical protein UFOVP247_112 [uncultured Caudovirales phage]|uniref:Uncharacterized protein n=1 Tax=uncultured Caudovirales phage TaxID=2100421 RepID=A0A6J7WYR9_9CAUD|nr:hypothetical protein UFOVP247_112 [uncultured Caudovirales phage]
MDPNTSIDFINLFNDTMFDLVLFIVIPILAWILISK